MSTVFNNVFVTRGAGSLVPATRFNKVVISDCAIGALRVDRGHIGIRKDDIGNVVTSELILPDPNNIPLTIKKENWYLNTELLAIFDGNLEAGPLSFYGKDITSMIVRRSSNRKAYTEWEDLRIVDNVKELAKDGFNYSFTDQTVESGIMYCYGVQPISGYDRGTLYKGMITAVVYEDIFLVGEGGKQLKIRFNPNVSSVKTNIKDARVETIGSKYPFITRNGNVGYKEFPLSGTITHFMDTTEEFAPRAELFIEDELKDLVENVDMTDLYDALYASKGLNDFNNEILEREFRDKVIAFLQDGKPKLFKSPTEGVMIVRIMDVNLTPNQQLGRMIYDFSCNVIEVDKYSLDNLNKYNIQERGSLDNVL